MDPVIAAFICIGWLVYLAWFAPGPTDWPAIVLMVTVALCAILDTGLTRIAKAVEEVARHAASRR